MDDCVFCKIVKGEIPAEIVDQTDNLIVFKDKDPKAPVHLLIVPKIHIKDLGELAMSLWVDIGNMAKKIAKEKNISGFRLVHNAGNAAVVPHMHVHFLAEVTVGRRV